VNYAGHDAHAAALWLIDGARSAQQPDQVLAQLCARLVDCGIPLWRVAVFVRTLHPHIMGRRFLWRADAADGAVAVSSAPHEQTDTDEFRLSPFYQVYNTGAALMRHLADAACPMDFAILEGLRADGVTDYLATPLTFINGEVHAVTWTTRAPGGFDARQLAGIEAVVAPLARVAEIWALRRVTRNLLDTYVGTHAGERILAGRIQRGHTEAISAAIWLSDMRGFTALADRLAPQQLIDLLNRYFDAQVPGIAAAGGEVLKFMGDGLLAIFPVLPEDQGGARACLAALAAARHARANVAALGRSTGIGGVELVRFGLALHLGEVLYGNIGGAARLDFTCIGPAVNLAARIETLCGELGRAVLASAEFARHCRGELVPLGEFPMRGFAAAQAVFGLPEEAAPD
jgi:adenylate cyclase